jgi:hypothetical protein
MDFGLIPIVEHDPGLHELDDEQNSAKRKTPEFNSQRRNKTATVDLEFE